MRKVCYIISDILIAASLAGAYVVQSFTRRKLGMSRWVMFQVRKWQEALPLETLRLVAPAAALGIFIALLALYWKRKATLKKIVLPIVLVAGVLSAFYLGFTLLKNPETVKAYYLVLPLIGLAVFVQLAKTWAAVMVCKNEK